MHQKKIIFAAMQQIIDFYYKHIYAVIGTLLFHIFLFVAMLVYAVPERQTYVEPEMLIDMELLEKVLMQQEQQEVQEAQALSASPSASTNRASRVGKKSDAKQVAQAKDPFFDEAFAREMAEARALAADVSSQLDKKTKAQEEYAMPEENTDGMNPEDISNNIYSGESNIYYELGNRYHRRLPIPVYLAKGGGRVVVNIWVNNSGKVVKAEIKSVENAHDPMLADYALQAAQRTRFNADDAAPNPQQGYISYLFVAQ
ncbi:MAG: energy transducer TonB [Mangrovibacterium sp.]